MGALLAVFVVLAFGVSVAQAAPKGVAEFFGNPTAFGSPIAGQFGSGGPLGAAVNSNSASPHFGDVYVVDLGNRRVQRFSSLGVFERMWGRDVIKTSPEVNTDLGNVAEICTHGPDCKTGVVGPRGGELAAPNGITVDQATGDVYVTDRIGGSAGSRVHVFTGDGEFVRMWGAGVVDGGATGTGTVTAGSTVVTAVVTTSKAFVVGQTVTGTGIAAGTFITSVSGTSMTLSQAATVAAGGAGTAISAPIAAGNVVRNERQTVTLGANTTGGVFTLSFSTPNPSSTNAVTAAIPWDASAGAVQAALEGLSNIGPGDVQVTSSNPGGGVVGGPYEVEFQGTRFADTDVTQMGSNPNGLTVGSGAKAATVATVLGGASAAEVCTEPKGCRNSMFGTRGGEFADDGISSTSGGGNGIAVSPIVNPLTGAGNVIVTDAGNRRVQEFTSTGGFVRAFGWDTTIDGSPSDPASDSSFQVCTVAADCKEATNAPGAEAGRFGIGGPNRVAVDSTGAIYTVENTANFRVQKFTPQVGPPTLGPSLFNPDVGGTGPALNLTGTSSSDAPMDIAIGPSDRLFVVKAFPAGAGTPAAAVNERRVVELDGAGSLIDTHAARSGIPGSTFLALNSDSEDIYMPTSAAPAGGGVGVYVLGPSSVPTVSLGVSGVSTHTAQLNGLVNPGGPDTPIGIRTKYRFEYRKIGAPTWIALSADKDAGNGFATVSVVENLDDLEAGTAYEARLVASKPFSGVASIVTAPESFTTPASQPDVDAVYVTDRETTSATLNARINPNGLATSYRFQYGTTAAYGATVPVPDGNAGAGTASLIFSEAIAGLQPETTYHYRLIATNANGTNTSADRTFTTRPTPPAPDGRAYELVSPADKIGGSGVGPWYAGVGSHGNAGIPAYEGDRFASLSYYGASLAEGGFSYGSDWTLGERTPIGWVNRTAFTRAGGQGSAEWAKIALTDSGSDDLSLTSWTGGGSQLSIFPEQPEAFGEDLGETGGAALREWDSGRWEIGAPWAAGQQTAGAFSVNTRVAADGGYALISGGLRGVAGPGDPTGGDPCANSCEANVYVDDVTAGLSDSFPGAGIRSLVNVCTGAGPSRTLIPSVDGDGKLVAAECPAEVISQRGASVSASSRDHMTADGSRVFFLSPSHNFVSADDAACGGVGAVGTECPPQVYVWQRNQDGSATTRWISKSKVAGQDASLTGPAVFEGATPDGDKVFFRTASPLTADDPNGGPQVPGGVRTGLPSQSSFDLYMYDFPDAPGADLGDGTLTRISAGPTGDGDANVSTDGADVSASGLRALGADGSRVYFVTAAPLPGVAGPESGTITSPGGGVNEAAFKNLYIYDSQRSVDQRWRFIARLPATTSFGRCAARGALSASAETLFAGINGTGLNGAVKINSLSNCVRATADGSFVTIFTDGRLTADDPDAVTGDVYAYDGDSGELTRMSAPQGGAGHSYVCVTEGSGTGTHCHGDMRINGLGTGRRGLSVVTDPADPADRVAFFESASQLVPEDQNDVYDVYQWRNGKLSLVSTGAAGAEPALYQGNDRTGRNVYVSTRDRLTWQDHDAVLDVYVARVDGGIPQPDPPPACVLLADGCQGGGASAVSSAAKTVSSGGANADGGVRTTLVVGGLSSRARRAASRSGVLRVVVRSSGPGRVTAVAKARIGKRSRRVARRTVQMGKAGKATLALRLSRPARKRLRAGRALGVVVRVSSPGVRSRSMTVRLPGVKS